MTAAAALTCTKYAVLPNEGYSVYQVSYTKGAQNDTFAVSTQIPEIQTILFVFAQDDTTGNVDPATWSGLTVTLTSTDTGTGSMLIVGKC